MNTLFKKNEKIFVLQSLIRANTTQESIFKLFALEKIVEKAAPSKTFTEDELLILVEDFPYMLPRGHMLDLILSVEYTIQGLILLADYIQSPDRPVILFSASLTFVVAASWYTDFLDCAGEEEESLHLGQLR